MRKPRELFFWFKGFCPCLPSRHSADRESLLDDDGNPKVEMGSMSGLPFGEDVSASRIISDGEEPDGFCPRIFKPS